MRTIQQVWVVFLCLALLFASTYSVAAPFEPQQQGEDPNAANLTPQEIDNLVAPIALYPDALVAQVLAAATYPDQITQANQWVKSNPNLKGQDLLNAADKQPWDPSVKALTQFPSVLDNMAQNLSWTSAMGEAYYYQQADVMQSVQRLRKQAKAAGNLKSGSQITVVQQDPQTIVIQPAQPQVVYVPQYNPTVVYGTPYYPPGYSTGAMVATGLISFGVGMAVGAAINNSCCGWGWGYHGWGCNWHGGSVTYNRNVYVSRSAVYANGRPGYYGRTGAYGGNYNNRYNQNSNNNNRYNQNSNNRYGNRNTNVSGNTVNKGGNTVNINTGGNTNNNVNAANRQRPNSQPQARPANQDRGYGQQRQTSTKSGAFSDYNKGGNTRAQADRGRSSMGGGGGNRQAPARQSGGGRKR